MKGHGGSALCPGRLSQPISATAQNRNLACFMIVFIEAITEGECRSVNAQIRSAPFFRQVLD